VNRFPLIKMAANPSYNLDEIDVAAKLADKKIKVANFLFYSLVISCFTIGEWSW